MHNSSSWGSDNLPTAASDERELVLRASGEKAAFEELYRRYQPRVYRYLLTYAATREDAADLTQYVFMRALEALPSYRDYGAPFGAWLFRIARNAATDSYRRRHPTYPWQHIPEALQPRASSDPETDVVRREALNRLRVLIFRLDPAKQELLALRFAGCLTSAEIAILVGKSEAAVKKQITRVLRSLQEEYHD